MAIRSLSKKAKAGYCMGIATESLLYNMYYTYYLAFLTDVAHMSAGLAGTVSLISVIWDAVTDPIIGAFADRPGADKRKFMMRAAFPVGLTFVAAFFPLNDGTSDIVKFIFYTAMTMLFWLAYTVYTIPYYAIVAEITEDYDERTSIRGASSMFNNVCIFLGNALPSLLPGVFVGMGITLALGWLSTAVVMAVLAIALGVIASLSLRNVKLIKPDSAVKEKVTIKSYVEIFKIKPFRWFVMFVFFFLMGSSMLQTNFEYLVVRRLEMSQDDMVIVIVALVASMAVMTPIVTKVAEKLDRRTAGLIFISITVACLVVMKIIGVNNTGGLIAEVCFVGVGLACFWAIFYSMAYDLVEVDEFVNGKRRESMITAVPQFYQKFGSAIGMWLCGQILSRSGYDGKLAVQAQQAKDAIENIATVIPCIFFVISLIGLFMYPVTKRRFAFLMTQLEKKRANERYSIEGLEKLV